MSGTPLIDMSVKLFVAVKKSQTILAEWILPHSEINDKTALERLLGVLDDAELVREMREVEETIDTNALIADEGVSDRFGHL